MKNLYILIFLFFSTVISVSAQYPEQSTLVVSLSDNSPLVISVDGRKFNKYGASITVNDLPKGWHTLKVYEYLEYVKGGGRARLLYSGRIRVKRGTMNYAVLDMNSLRINMRTVEVEQDYADRTEDNMDMPVEQEGKEPATKELRQLKQKVTEKVTDTERLKLLKKELGEEQYYADELRTMMDWLAFESSKLDFAKWSYKRVEDKQNFPALENVFLLDENKDAFNQFVAAQE